MIDIKKKLIEEIENTIVLEQLTQIVTQSDKLWRLSLQRNKD